MWLYYRKFILIILYQKIALSKELEGKYVLDVYFSRKDILRSAYKLPRKINVKAGKKMPSEFYDQY